MRFLLGYRRDKAITLIALVVSIIVLLILAGVSIAMLMGKNKILTQAQSAKNLYTKSNFKEKIQLVIVPYILRDNSIEENEIASITDELASYGIETRKIPSYDGKIDLEAKDSENNICLITNEGNIIDKVEGNKNDWEISNYRNYYMIKKYIGENVENLVIPNYIDGKWIQALRGIHAKNSIVDGYNIKSINIMEGIKKLDTSSFLGITSIETVKLPNTLKDIDWGAFKGCSNLKEINFPNSLSLIGQVSFDSCTSLSTELILGEKIEQIGTYAFANSSVKKIKINREKDTVRIDPRSII